MRGPLIANDAPGSDGREITGADFSVDGSGNGSVRTLAVAMAPLALIPTGAFTYVAAGNGAGKLETATFTDVNGNTKLLTLTYNSDDKLSGYALT